MQRLGSFSVRRLFYPTIWRTPPMQCRGGLILHAEIVLSLHSFTPYSARMAMVTLKIVGGRLTIIVVYLVFTV